MSAGHRVHPPDNRVRPPGRSIPGSSIRVRGGASEDDVAAIVEALNRVKVLHQPAGYDRWRANRLAALRVRPVR